MVCLRNISVDTQHKGDAVDDDDDDDDDNNNNNNNMSVEIRLVNRPYDFCSEFLF
jgi:hypothetical protein